MPERHGFVHGSKPEHKVGDKSRVLKSRKANPPVTNAQVAAGFEKFYGTTPPPERLPRKLITWKHQDFHGGPKGRRPLEPNVVGDRPSGARPLCFTSPHRRCLTHGVLWLVLTRQGVPTAYQARIPAQPWPQVDCWCVAAPCICAACRVCA